MIATRSVHTRTRAGILVLALALVGGTGCITASIINDVQYKNRMRVAENAHKQRIAQLTPAAEAGDPVAATSLARALLYGPGQVAIDQARVYALLSRAADGGHAPAQALLGERLVLRSLRRNGSIDTVPNQAAQDRERGLLLLRQAASAACTFITPPDEPWYDSVRPANLLALELANDKRTDEARLWRARAALHCGDPTASTLSWRAQAKNLTPPDRAEALALLLLQNRDAERIAKATAALPGEEVAAARRDAEQLREQIAQSERQYPAPRQKEMY